MTEMNATSFCPSSGVDYPLAMLWLTRKEHKVMDPTWKLMKTV